MDSLDFSSTIAIALLQLYLIKQLTLDANEIRKTRTAKYLSWVGLLFSGLLQIFYYDRAVNRLIKQNTFEILGGYEPGSGSFGFSSARQTNALRGLPYVFNSDGQENYYRVKRGSNHSRSYREDRRKLHLDENPMKGVTPNLLKDRNYELFKYMTLDPRIKKHMELKNPAFDPKVEDTWPYQEKALKGGKYEDWSNEFKKPIPEYDGKPKKAMIIAGWRIGFEFVSALFERHPDVFYLYEPFMLTNLFRDPTIFHDGHEFGKKTRKIANIFEEFFTDCILPRYDRYREWYRHGQLLAQGKNCSMDNMCMRHYEFKLRTAPICKDDFLQLGTGPEIIKKECPLDEKRLTIAEKYCRNDKARVIKANNINSILTDVPYEFKFDPDFNVVVWIRDPRSMVAGKWRGLGKTTYTLGQADRDCTLWEYYVKDATYYADRWKMQIRFARYEDFVNDPIYQAKDLFHFLDLDFPDVLSEFLYQETHMGYGPTADSPYISLNNTYMYDFASLRHGSYMPYRWLSDLTFREIEDIQNLMPCKKVLDYFGYETLTRESYEKYKKIYAYKWYDFHWDMKDGTVPVKMLAGRSQRANKDEEFLINWESKLWGFDDR